MSRDTRHFVRKLTPPGANCTLKAKFIVGYQWTNIWQKVPCPVAGRKGCSRQLSVAVFGTVAIRLQFLQAGRISFKISQS